MATLTKKEEAWVKKVQKVLDECPSKRIGFYTIGDPTVHLFDVTKLDAVYHEMDRYRGSTDFGLAVDAINVGFDEDLTFPNPVESTAG